MTAPVSGIFPVVITPFSEADTIDWDGYARLIEWYLDHGAQGIFAVCQSSEMQRLSLTERRDLAQFTVEHVAGRVPVVASGHISDAHEDQIDELCAVAATGVDAVVFVTNRLTAPGDARGTLILRLKALIGALPESTRFGLYECPAPYRRLLTDDELTWCAQHGRFDFLKDVSCDLNTVERRISLARGTPLAINNANAALAWPIMQAGGQGFSGVMNNFHPDLYRWLYEYGVEHSDLADELDTFLVLAAMCEPFGYPKLAKAFHNRIGTFKSSHSRVVPYALGERHWAIEAVLDQIIEGADRFRTRISALS